MVPLRDIGCNRSSTNSIRCNCNKMLSTYHEWNILNTILADCKSVSIYIRISDLKSCGTLGHYHRYSKAMLVSYLTTRFYLECKYLLSRPWGNIGKCQLCLHWYSAYKLLHSLSFLFSLCLKAVKASNKEKTI